MNAKGGWCSCGVKDLGERVYQIKYCPKHKAAPALYEALRDFGLFVAVNYDAENKPFYYIDKEWLDKRSKAIAKAEGK